MKWKKKQSVAKGAWAYPQPMILKENSKNEKKLLFFVCLFILGQRFQSFPTIFPLTW
jgi:hypothetical protein